MSGGERSANADQLSIELYSLKGESPEDVPVTPYPDMFPMASDCGDPAWFPFQQGGEAPAAFVPQVPGDGVRK